jgi:molybdate transport system substrate-binding protein
MISLGNAAEIKVMGSTGVKSVVTQLAQQFEAETGHKVVTAFDVFAVLARRIDAGETFDIAILTPELIDGLIRQGKIAADARTNFGRTGLGVGMRKGAPRLDIGSVEALKRSLLDAKSVAYSKEGTSGAQFLSLLNRLGIAADMKCKLKAYDTSGLAQAIATGEAELVATGIGPILAMPGTEFLGGLPPELQTYIVFTAGVSTNARQPDPVRALLRFMSAPAAAPLKKARGLEPG